jgi:uncharacterized membrane protein YeiH
MNRNAILSLPLLLTADLVGTFLFGIEGATAAIGGNLDLLGVMVLAFATALAGGLFRDLLIGAVPPNAIRDWRYPVAAFAGAAIVFFLHRSLQEIPGMIIMVLDAAGLSLFAIAGTEKALLYKIHPFLAILLGAVTGVGGGTVRDIFLARAECSAHGYLRDRGAGWSGGHDCVPQVAVAFPPCRAFSEESFASYCAWSASGSIGICRK